MASFISPFHSPPHFQVCLFFLSLATMAVFCCLFLLYPPALRASDRRTDGLTGIIHPPHPPCIPPCTRLTPSSIHLTYFAPLLPLDPRKRACQFSHAPPPRKEGLLLWLGRAARDKVGGEDWETFPFQQSPPPT